MPTHKNLREKVLRRLNLAYPLLLFALAACAVQAPQATFSVPTAVAATPPPSSGTLYVSTGGSDRKSGESPEAAFATINHALSAAQARRERGGATVINVLPGVYRQSVENWTPSNGPPIIVRGPEAVVSGSEVYTDWEEEGANVYSHPWTYDWGFPAKPTNPFEDVNPMIARKECVFNDGRLLRQVRSEDALRENTFYVDERRDKLFINVPDLGAVEVCERSELWKANRTRNLRVEGLTFQHAASPWGGSAVDVRDFQTYDGVTVRWNSQAGVHAHGEGFVIRNSRMNDNGFSGLTGYAVKNSLIENSEWSRNNWRGDWWGHYGWDTGNKILGVRGLTLRGNLVEGNMSPGWWCDTDCMGVEIYNNTFRNNRVGINLELSQGPFEVYNNTFSGNTFYDINCATVDRCRVKNNKMENALKVTLDGRCVSARGRRPDCSKQPWRNPFKLRKNYHPSLLGFEIEGNTYNQVVFEYVDDKELEVMREGKPNKEGVESAAAVWRDNDDKTLPADEKVKLVRDDGSGTRYYSEREFARQFFNPTWSTFD